MDEFVVKQIQAWKPSCIFVTVICINFSPKSAIRRSRVSSRKCLLKVEKTGPESINFSYYFQPNDLFQSRRNIIHLEQLSSLKTNLNQRKYLRMIIHSGPILATLYSVNHSNLAEKMIKCLGL